ncbi:MAG: C13 family peptidase [Acidobacteriota bacterium]
MAQSSRHALIVTGVAGEAEFKEKFWTWSTQMMQILGEQMNVAPENVSFLAGDPASDSSLITAKSTKAELTRAFQKLKSRAREGDLVFILMIGHGTYDGVHYKFNLPGPDITGSELKSLLDDLSAQDVVLVCATSSSGILARQLSQKRRVIIAATKNEFENNDTIFAQFFVEAFKDLNADTDKNSRVSFLEAYLYAAQKVDNWYKDQKRLATEHPVLEDNGDGVPVSLPSPANKEGLYAGTLSLAPEGSLAALPAGQLADQPELWALVEQKQKIEAAIQKLKYQKTTLEEGRYQQDMESLLIQLAQTNKKIREMGKR